jgi:hypothetical protein
LFIDHDNPAVLIDNAIVGTVGRRGTGMATYLNHTPLIEWVIDVRLHLAIHGDTAVGQNRFSLVAADAVQAVHNKIEQRVGMLDLADDGLVVVAGYSVVVTGHF